MKFVDLSEHLRSLRPGRSHSAAMRVMEVWQAAIKCPKNGIGEIFYNETRLPSPFLGLFSRWKIAGGQDIAEIFVHKPHPSSHKRRLEPHWKELVIIKELMHCWSPKASFVGTPSTAETLVNTLTAPLGPFVGMGKSDYGALLAAAEVILPCSLVRAAMDKGKEPAQIAHEHGLHPEIMAFICRHDTLDMMAKGSL